MFPSTRIQFKDPHLKPIKQDLSYPQSSTNVENINLNINFDFEGNSPFQEGIMSKTFQRLDKFFSRAKRIR